MIIGVNVYGYVFAESGVGEVTRLLVETLRNADVEYSVNPVTATVSRQESGYADFGADSSDFDINIIGVNADQVPVFAEAVGRDRLDGRYNIGIWAWEIEEFPDRMAESAAFLDEVWGISSFTAAAIAKKIDIPVYSFPLPIRTPEPVLRSRFDLDLPESFLFLYCFDLDSVFARKNPLAVIDAYTAAFPEPNGAHLMVKSINGDRHFDQVEELLVAAGGRPDITYRDGYSTAEEQSALMNSCDAYISLHRAEGYGLTMAEAMALGKPVVATGYSGNLDFMTDENSYLVPIEIVSVGVGSDPYPPEAVWADPDVKAASKMIREVYGAPDQVQRRVEIASRDIEQLHSPAARARFITERLAAIRATRDGG